MAINKTPMHHSSHGIKSAAPKLTPVYANEVVPKWVQVVPFEILFEISLVLEGAKSMVVVARVTKKFIWFLETGYLNRSSSFMVNILVLKMLFKIF
jgi:hypothetical protein